MRNLFSIPSSLIAILISSTWPATIAAEQPWPYNLPKHQKYWPEHERLAQRHNEVAQQLATQAPSGMRKMSEDPGEMFFLDYWSFDHPEEPTEIVSGTAQGISHRATGSQPLAVYANGTGTLEFLPPLTLHTDDFKVQPLQIRGLNVFDKRNFQCPAGTNACTSISRPNSCCATDETCVIIHDSGLGDVGCCPNGQKCGGSVSQCMTSQGYSSCPGSKNGGCCIPNYACMDVGCVATGYTTTTVYPVVTMTITSGQQTTSSTSTPAPTPVTTTETIVLTNTVIQSNPPSPTQPPSTRTVYTTVNPATTLVVIPASAPSQGNTTCATGFNSCPSSMGGGCCPTDRACGTGGICPPLVTETLTVTQTSSAVGAGAPVRPTSDDTSPTPSPMTTVPASVCPTGYYMCSAVYIGGCCQVDRNCDSTSCPPSSSTTVNSAGKTIVVAYGISSLAGSAQTSAATSTTTEAAATTITPASTTTIAPSSGDQARCANGWYTCGANDGGGCCPFGYACGASCRATNAAGPSSVNKIAPASGGNQALIFERWSIVLMAGVIGTVGAGMVLL